VFHEKVQASHIITLSVFRDYSRRVAAIDLAGPSLNFTNSFPSPCKRHRALPRIDGGKPEGWLFYSRLAGIGRSGSENDQE
jgi:hypothetical protein